MYIEIAFLKGMTSSKSPGISAQAIYVPRGGHFGGHSLFYNRAYQKIIVVPEYLHYRNLHVQYRYICKFVMCIAY